MSSDSTNSKAQSDAVPRGQKRPASASDDSNQKHKTTKQDTKPSEPTNPSKSALGELHAMTAEQTPEKRLEAENLRLQEECRAAKTENARLEAYHWAREAITEEEKKLREIIKQRDATIQSRDSRVSKLEADVSKLKAEVEKRKMWSGELWTDWNQAQEQLAKMTTAHNTEKTTREQLEAKITELNERRAIGCSLARDVRCWLKNFQAGNFAQAGKYQEDAARTAKDFNCGDTGCTSCPKGEGGRGLRAA